MVVFNFVKERKFKLFMKHYMNYYIGYHLYGSLSFLYAVKHNDRNNKTTMRHYVELQIKDIVIKYTLCPRCRYSVYLYC